MAEKNTLAVICNNVEDAKFAAENTSARHYRLFLVSEELPEDAPWLRTTDGMLHIGKPSLDSLNAVAARAALLYSPSWCVALVEADDATDEIADRLLRDAERDGYAQEGRAWACTKAHAVQYGAPGLSGGAPAAPSAAELTPEQLATLLADLVPMFGVRFSPSVSGEWAWVRQLLEEVCTEASDGAVHCQFVTEADDFQAAEVARGGMVVLLTRGEPPSTPNYSLAMAGGAKALLYAR